MFAAAIMFGVLFSLAVLAAESLSSFSRSRLEKYCSTRKPSLLGDVLGEKDPTYLSIHAWAWILISGLMLTIWQAFGKDLAAGNGPADRWVLAVQFTGIWLGIAAFELWVIRPLGRVFAEPVLYWTWPMLKFLRLSMFPVIQIERLANPALHRLSGRQQNKLPVAFEEEILTVVNEGEREGVIQEEAAEMFEGLIELPRTTVTEIMTPRTEMVMLKSTLSIEESRKVISQYGHSRIPVFGENRDQVIGILYAKDLLPHLSNDSRISEGLTQLELRKPIYVPETKPIDILLREFQKGRAHIAIVLDEYGGVAGLVTLEDILEEIVGEIADEYDSEEPPRIQRIDQNRIEVDARVHVDELNAELPLKIPEDADYETMAGFILGTLGYVPKTGEMFRHEQATYTILGASDRTVKRVRIAIKEQG